jgi:hypothetical protein
MFAMRLKQYALFGDRLSKIGWDFETIGLSKPKVPPHSVLEVTVAITQR